MTDSEIVHAKARANDCVNGFMKVRMQQARDVVKLAEALQAANRKLDAINLELMACQDLKNKPGFYGGSIFDDLMKGKNP